MISIIVAVSDNGVIGVNGKLPWNIPEDLKRFKKITTNHNVIMGRKTFESIGKGLPNRTNFVLTSSVDSIKLKDGCIFTNKIDLEELQSPDVEWFIIGGESIYRYFLPYADKIYLTNFKLSLKSASVSQENQSSFFEKLIKFC